MERISIQTSTTTYCFKSAATTTPTKYNGSNTPYTSFVTTCIEIANNQTQNSWTPTAATATLVYGGGAPFTNGARPHFKSYGNVTETIPITLRATTAAYAANLKQILFEVLNGQTTTPVYLQIENSDTLRKIQAVIYSADIQEEPAYFNTEGDLGVLRATITLVRSPFFSQQIATAPPTSINAGAIGNTGTGSPDNVVAYAASPKGDLRYAGQPTHVVVTPSDSRTYKTFYIASIYSNTYSTSGAGALSTSSTTGTATALNAPNVSAAYTQGGLKARSLMRFTNNTSNVQVRVEMRANSAGVLLYAGPWITPTSGSATLYDMGEIPLDVFRSTPTSSTLQLYIGYRSTNGSSATTTLGYNELLLYYDFCRVDVPTGIIPATNPTELHLLSFYTAFVAEQPLPTPICVSTTTADAVYEVATVRGSYPRLIDGGSIYVAWLAANNVHVTGDTGTVTVDYSPLWLTFVGVD